MKHEIDLKKYKIHTDLAIESLENSLPYESVVINDIKISRVKIDETNKKSFEKKCGLYTTIEFKDITDYTNRNNVEDVLTMELKKIITLNNIKETASCLIVGLGNKKSTPDALGPSVIDNILVTNHLFMYGTVEKGFRKTFALTPNVLASTGIESHDLIEGVIKEVNPDFVIVIDSLASTSLSRVNSTIQITDTGINPGSGIGNNRKEISYDTLNVPVIAIGVPTVIDAVNIVSNTINYMFKHYSYNINNKNKSKNKLVLASQINYLDEEIEIKPEDKEKLLGIIGLLADDEINELIYEVLTPIGYNFMVTTKDIDFIIEKLALLIGNGINRALHENVD